MRQTAVDIVKGLTGSPDGIDQLKGQLSKLLLSLLRLVADRSAAVSGSALAALVNLSQDPTAVNELLRLNVVGRVMDYIREKNSPHTGLLVSPAAARLANAARPPAARPERGASSRCGMHP